MMEISRGDIRRLLKTFGIEADESVIAHISQGLAVSELRLRITLTDLTNYGTNPPEQPLGLEIEGSVSL